MSGLEITLSSDLDNLVMDSWSYKKIDSKIYVDTMLPEQDMAPVISDLSKQGANIENVRIYRSSLEDVFMKLTGKSMQVEEKNIEPEGDKLNV